MQDSVYKFIIFWISEISLSVIVEQIVTPTVSCEVLPITEHVILSVFVGCRTTRTHSRQRSAAELHSGWESVHFLRTEGALSSSGRSRSNGQLHNTAVTGGSCSRRPVNCFYWIYFDSLFATASWVAWGVVSSEGWWLVYRPSRIVRPDLLWWTARTENPKGPTGGVLLLYVWVCLGWSGLWNVVKLVV